MCGIAGIFSYLEADKKWPEDGLDAMLKTVKHRGPDGSGKHIEPGLFLGHTRLAVIDLSSAGDQPMFSADKKYVISFNGEIYNFKELRKELISKGYKFVSHSDTEVLINAWYEWKEACLDKLDGIFAFAVFDRHKKELFLVRDHLGVKPLFYMIDKGQIFFASEPLALFGPLNPCPGIDCEDLNVYFTFNYLAAPRTGLKGVYQLQPGCLLKVDNNGAGSLRRYWQVGYHKDPEPWSNKQAKHFERILFDSVSSQMVSDAPLGLFLSGGLDSYAVASSAVLTGQKPVTFTLGFDDPGFDEAPEAMSYARYLHVLNENSKFSFTESEVRQTLNSMNELLADASCFPAYQLSRFARKKVTVVLSGDGGDELLAGYDTYRAGEITPYLNMIPGNLKMMMRGVIRHLPSDNRRYGWKMVAARLLEASDEGRGRDHVSFRRIFNTFMKKRLYDPDFYKKTAQLDPLGEYVDFMKEVPFERSYLTARQHADMMFHLPSILAKVDRMSMANGLEVRVPLLNRQMVEFCMNLPDNAKIHGTKGKRILRQAVCGKIPAGALKRPKAGFLPPVDRWFRQPGPMVNVFGDYLNSAKSSLGWLKWDEVGKLWDEHRHTKEDAGFILLGVLQFINWGLRFGKGSGKE